MISDEILQNTNIGKFNISFKGLHKNIKAGSYLKSFGMSGLLGILNNTS